MRTYTFNVVIEPDEDRWFAYCPVLEDRGAATWGYTKNEARANIYEVLKMTLASMIDHDEAIPENIVVANESPEELLIAVTL